MSRQHALASPSSSKRWLKCTASPGFIERVSAQLPAEVESSYSLEGTEAHRLAAHCLVMGEIDDSLFPATPDGREMKRHVTDYVRLIQGWVTDDTDLMVEYEVPLFYRPEESGCIDAAVIHRDGSAVRIGDKKYGKGVSVQAKNNTQLAIYAMSLIVQLDWMYGFTDNTLVSMMIFQPRIDGEPAIRLWCVKLDELKAFCEHIAYTAVAIYANPNGGEFSPDDETCQFCPAVALCGARAAQLFGALPNETEMGLVNVQAKHIPLPLPESLSVDQLSRLVAVAPEMKEWLNKCEAVAAKRLHDGLTMPGFKLVVGRSNRVWRSEDEAAELLLNHTELPPDEVYKTDVISPAQAEEKLSKKDWDAIRHAVVKPPGRPVMVPESDKRPAFDAAPATFFPNLESGTSLLD